MPLNTQSRQVLQSAFGDKWPQAWVEWWKFNPDEPSDVDPLTHRRARAADANPPDDYAVFFCVGLIVPGGRRCNADVERVHVLVLDDVGTKIDQGLVDMFAPLLPSFVVETSKGNFQYMWAVHDGLTIEQFRSARSGMEKIFGPSDCGAPAHLVRLPMGVNGKPSKTADAVRKVLR